MRMQKILMMSSCLAALLFVMHTAASAADFAGRFNVPKNPPVKVSADGKTFYYAQPVKAFVVDPNPPAVKRRVPAPAHLTAPQTQVTATFVVDYVANGGQDPWGEPCYTFPAEAKTAFNKAVEIWSKTISSNVPITIRACWAKLTDGGNPDAFTLGYSGGAPLHINESNFPKQDTVYTGALANSLQGQDLATYDPSDPLAHYDMHITYNDYFTWYFGTDGNTPGGQMDLVSVVLHEIGHGLNFSGSVYESSGIFDWGYTCASCPIYPDIYDTFMRDGSGNQLINTSLYPHQSSQLASLVQSNNLWFHGSNAMAANGGQRVKMYAPASWQGGSSYSHLDYDTFNNTANQLMVYAISDGESIHDPGEITRGLLQDLGWGQAAASSPWPMYLSAIMAAGNKPVPPPPPPPSESWWGAQTVIYCPSSVTTFSLTSGGVTKTSSCPAGYCPGGSGSFAGWVTVSPGTKSFSAKLTAGGCGNWSANFSHTLAKDKSYIFMMDLNASSNPTIYIYAGDGKPSGAGGGGLEEAGGQWSFVEAVPFAGNGGMLERAL